MDARWQDKLTGNSVPLDDVWKWGVIVIAWFQTLAAETQKAKAHESNDNGSLLQQ